jgi:hypothetical protein
MKIPRDPNALIGAIVRSNRESAHLFGTIQRIGVDSDRPFVLWDGNSKAIVAEWEHVSVIAETGVFQTLLCSSSEFIAALKRILGATSVTPEEVLSGLKKSSNHAV